MNTVIASVKRPRCLASQIAAVSATQQHYARKALAGFAVAGLFLSSMPAFSQVLGTASNFAVLGATPSVANTGNSVISGSVGVWPAASITGFPPGLIAPGTGFLNFGDAIAQQAQTDTTAAYLNLAGRVSGAIAPALGGVTLTPGTYSAGAATLTGTLTLNGPGLYVFQTTSLNTAAGPGAAVVNLINGATSCDVWWQVGSSAALGTFTAFQGNIVALTSITLGTSASLQGRALARNGTVTLDNNAVTACTGGTTPGYLVPPPALVPGLSTAGPTLSEWAMIMLAGLLAIAAFPGMQKRIISSK